MKTLKRIGKGNGFRLLINARLYDICEVIDFWRGLIINGQVFDPTVWRHI